MAKPNLRPDHNGTQRAQFESHKKKIYATQNICGICGKEVDFGFKFPHPLSPCIDHILLGSVRQTAYAEDDAAVLEKFATLSPDNKRLALAFMDMLSDDFQK